MYFEINRGLKEVKVLVQELKDGDDIPGGLDDEYNALGDPTGQG